MQMGQPTVSAAVVRRLDVAVRLGLGFALLSAVARAAEPSSAREVLDRLQAQSAKVAAMDPQQRYTYTKVLVTDELDSKGGVKSRKEKRYEVQWIAGATYQKLKRLEGEKLSEEQLRREQDQEERNREALGEDKAPAPGQKTRPLVTWDLLGRFDFHVEGRVLNRGETNLLLSFKPRGQGVPVRKLSDRVINRLEGRIWVNEAEQEITRAETRLSEKVSFWGGILGSLDRFELVLERQSGDPGVWYNKSADISISGRKLLDGFRFHGHEEASGFQRLAGAGTAQTLMAEGPQAQSPAAGRSE